MKQIIKIEDYFEDQLLTGLSYNDRNKVIKFRDNLNSFQSVGEQIDFILEWRKSKANRNFDKRCFGIDLNAELDLNLVRQKESFYSINNEYWNGYQTEDISNLNNKSLGNNVKFLINNYKPILITISIILVISLILNATLYVIGLKNSIGETPFVFCANGSSVSSGSLEGYSKVKDGYKIPVDYIIAGEGYTGQGYNGDDSNRGKGVFASEDFLIGNSDSFSYNNYAVSARWEYATYEVSENAWPEHSSYGNGTSDGVNVSTITTTDDTQYSWTYKQKVIVFNPENGKAVVCICGFGEEYQNNNWGGAPLNCVGGLSYKAQEALGFKVGTLDGGDYETNCRDSGVQLEMYWAPENAIVGPVNGEFNLLSGSTSDCQSSSYRSAGNSSIAEAAVSIAFETKDEALISDGTPLYKYLKDTIGLGSIYKDCGVCAATAIRWSGADDSFPIGTYNEEEYMINNPDKWQQITEFNGLNIEVLQPGDILLYDAKGDGMGHIMIYVGNDIVRKKFPNSDADLVAASYNQYSPCCKDAYDDLKYFYDQGTPMKAWRNIKQENNSIYNDLKYNGS